MTPDEIDAVPDWAIREAVKRIGDLFGMEAWERRDAAKRKTSAASAATVLAASLIAKHEEPPISDELRIAREAASGVCGDSYVSEIKDGDWDQSVSVRSALHAIELWKAR